MQVFAAPPHRTRFCGYLVKHLLLIGMHLFLLYFRPLGFENSLIEKLRTICMGINESVDNSWGRVNDILLRMDNHHILSNFLRNIFIGEDFL